MQFLFRLRVVRAFRVVNPQSPLVIGMLATLTVLVSLQPLFAQARPMAERLEGHYAKGLQFFQAGDLGAAEKEFQQIATLAPQVPEPYYFLAKIAASRNSLAQAETLLNTALRLKPDFVEAHHTMGVLCMQQKKYEQARDSFLQAIRLKANYALAHVNLGNAYLNLQQFEAASKEYQKALDTGSGDEAIVFLANFHLGSLYYSRDEYQRACSYFEKAHSLNRRHAEVLYSLADIYLKLGRRNDALGITGQIKNLPSGDPGAQLQLGLLLAENELYPEAVGELEQARRQLPASFEMLYGLATVYHHLNRNPESLAVLRNALDLRPHEAGAHYLLAQIYAELKDPRAVEALRQCVTEDPTRHEAWEALSKELFQRQAFGESVRTFQVYVQKFPDQALPHILLGEALMHSQGLPRALSEFQRAAEIAPELSRAHFSAGFIYKELGQPEKAKQALETALKCDPNNALANFHLGDLLSHEEIPDRALSLLKRAAQLKPDHAEAYVELGKIYLQQKRYQDALDELLKGIRLRPDFPEPHYILSRVYLGLGQQQKSSEAYQQFKLLGEKQRVAKRDQQTNAAR